MGRRFKVLTLIFSVMIFAVACGSGSGKEAVQQKPEVQLGKIEYETIDVNSQEFSELYSDSEFAAWYDESYKKEGLYSFDAEEDCYLLLSAGEKKTGGYSIDDIVLEGTESNIKVTASLHVPTEGSQVTQALTYPHVLLRIPADEREYVFDEFKEIQEAAKKEALTGTGIYTGQIDPQSIEIKISGAPEETAAKAFQLDESLMDNFEEKQGLQSGDKVKFSYFVDEHQRSIITQIEKL